MSAREMVATDGKQLNTDKVQKLSVKPSAEAVAAALAEIWTYRCAVDAEQPDHACLVTGDELWPVFEGTFKQIDEWRISRVLAVAFPVLAAQLGYVSRDVLLSDTAVEVAHTKVVVGTTAFATTCGTLLGRLIVVSGTKSRQRSQ